MDKAITIEVENLRRASVTSLRKRYRELFQQETRSRHREHLFRKIVWRLQALAEGELSERARARAREIANDADLRLLAPKSFFSVGGQLRATAGILIMFASMRSGRAGQHVLPNLFLLATSKIQSSPTSGQSNCLPSNGSTSIPCSGSSRFRGLLKESASKAQPGGSPSAFIRSQSRQSSHERQRGSHIFACA